MGRLLLEGAASVSSFISHPIITTVKFCDIKCYVSAQELEYRRQHFLVSTESALFFQGRFGAIFLGVWPSPDVQYFDTGSNFHAGFHKMLMPPLS